MENYSYEKKNKSSKQNEFFENFNFKKKSLIYITLRISIFFKIFVKIHQNNPLYYILS